MLKERIGSVRSIDVVHELGYSKPSVSVAMKRLREDGYIVMDKDGYITLTDSGEQVAESIYERHRVLSRAFVNLGVDAKTATEDACKIEHYISEQTFRQIKKHLVEDHNMKTED